jgi:hypothetical protein
VALLCEEGRAESEVVRVRPLVEDPGHGPAEGVSQRGVV